MTKAFLDFGDQVMKPGQLHSRQGFEGLAKAYCQTAKTFLSLAAEAHQEDSGPLDQQGSSNREPSPREESDGTLPAFPHAFDPSERDLNAERMSPVPFQGTQLEMPNQFSAGTTASTSGIPFLPTQIPLLSDDYGTLAEYPEPVLWKRIVRHAILKTYRALRASCEPHDVSQAWLARSHRFSLRHLSRHELLVLTKYTLDSMMQEIRDRSRNPLSFGPHPPKRNLSFHEYFCRDKNRQLGTAVLHDFGLLGISMSEIMRPTELESYLSTKGTFKVDGNRIVLQLYPSAGQGIPQNKDFTHPGNLQSVILDTDKLVCKLVEDTMCLGDGMGFPKRILNSAIVYSAIQIESNQ